MTTATSRETEMTDLSVEIITRPQPLPGRGLLHPFPTKDSRQVDPFVFLDMAAPEHIGDGSHFVAPYCHRGVQPIGLVFRGQVEHRDSLGDQVTVTSGGIQRLVAGSGVMHEEILAGDDGVLHAAQLGVNLPTAAKMNPPEHHAVDAATSLKSPRSAKARRFACTPAPSPESSVPRR
jgi:redox-sensitive bicupin YhaK (pirin superfamily)